MTATSAGSASPASPGSPSEYAEDGCALRWPLVLWGLAAPGALVLLFMLLGVFVQPEWFIAAVFVPLFAPFMVGIGLLYRNWPTALRIDGDGVRMGALGSRRAARRNPTVTHQNWGLFACEWPGIRDVDVVTDPVRLKEIRTSPQYFTLSNRWAKPRRMTACKVGVLTAPFMTAALVVRVDPDAAVVPPLRSTWFFPNRVNRPAAVRLTAEASSVWVVPTRRAEELRAFLAPAERPARS